MDNKKMGIGVRVMILKDNKVLLGRRRAELEKQVSALHGGGMWTMPGGKVDLGENLEEAIIRETEEETGAKVKPDKLSLISVAYDQINNIQFVTLGFLTSELIGEPKVVAGEITEWRWFPLSELPENIYFPTAQVLNNYLENKVY